ncbi:DUF2255 family protein [Microbacterium sp. NPDC019599]|uniref:DUF2255 family protein n=1 Tax=Microbacterium sp. NPDC019599 TaxID=3154690 RepID=UPI0033CFDAD4
MTGWTEAQLAELDAIDEVRVAGRRVDGSARTPVIVWHVVVDGAVYVRSVKGPDGQWYRGVVHHHEGILQWRDSTVDVSFIPDDSHDGAVDAAYLAKYGDYAPTRAVTNALAKQTTLRIEPR